MYENSCKYLYEIYEMYENSCKLMIYLCKDLYKICRHFYEMYENLCKHMYKIYQNLDKLYILSHPRSFMFETCKICVNNA